MGVDDECSLEKLRAAWEWNSDQEGFFSLLREGVFDLKKGEEILSVLQAVESPSSGQLLDPEFVKLTWFAAYSNRWHEDRVQRNGGDMKEFNRIVSGIESEVERILGIP